MRPLYYLRCPLEGGSLGDEVGVEFGLSSLVDAWRRLFVSLLYTLPALFSTLGGFVGHILLWRRVKAFRYAVQGISTIMASMRGDPRQLC